MTKPPIPLRPADRYAELLGWLLLLAVWALVLYHYPALPATVPIHYNAAGEADGFGAKWHLLLLPGVATLLFVGLTVLNRYPQHFNYPTRITPHNALRHYTNATRMIRYLKLIIVGIIALLAYQSIRDASGRSDGLGAWFLPLTLALTFLPLGYFLLRSMRSPRP